MNLFSLCISFFLTGLFAIGGGLAAIPIMQQFIVDRDLISRELFYNMVAVSESTPGPIGVNMATYIGFENYGVLGGIITTLCLTLPSFLTVLLIARSFTSMQEKPLVQNALYGIRASVAGLIASAAWSVLTVTVFTFDNFLKNPSIMTLFDYKQLVIFIAIFAFYKIFKKHPLWYILFGAICGIVFM